MYQEAVLWHSFFFPVEEEAITVAASDSLTASALRLLCLKIAGCFLASLQNALSWHAFLGCFQSLLGYPPIESLNCFIEKKSTCLQVFLCSLVS